MSDQSTNKQEFYDFTQKIGHLLRKANQKHLTIFQQNIGPYPLTSVQFVTLCALLNLGPSSQADLVKETAIDQATIRGIIDRLETRNLIKSTKIAADRRKVIVHLTEEGRAVLLEAMSYEINITELTLINLNPAERVAILYLLNKMIQD